MYDLRGRCEVRARWPHADSERTHTAGSLFALPRQEIGCNKQSCGVSAFAFQGTNAHVILQKTNAVAQTGHKGNLALDEVIWHHKWLWYSPKPHQMITSARFEQRTLKAEFEVQLSCSRLACLWDHQVSLSPTNLEITHCVRLSPEPEEFNLLRCLCDCLTL